jgi:tetratricopeptide (TPR) repeat protein
MNNIDGLFYAASREYRAGNIIESQSICNRILQMNPLHVEALYLKGMIESQRGEHQIAIECFKKTLEILPSHLDACFALGKSFEAKQMYEEAVTYYRKVISINPNHFGAQASIGFLLYNQRDLDNAQVHLEKAIELNPNFDESYCCIGMILRERGLYDQAITYFSKALEVNPNSAWAHMNIYVTRQHQNCPKEAKAHLKKALDLNKNICKFESNIEKILLKNQTSNNNYVYDNKQKKKKILIAVPVYNRKKITALSLEQTNCYKSDNCYLYVYNDHSTEYDNNFLAPYADEVTLLPNKLGVHKLRLHQLKAFLETGYDFLYLTDSDVMHDPEYIHMLEYLYKKGNKKLPVSLFNSVFTLQTNMILYYKQGFFLKTTAPGNSMFYDRSMVEKIVMESDREKSTFDHIPWDNKAVACLGLPWITPEISYLEHFGSGGMNNDSYERDRAVNPTDYLRQKRDLILKYLGDENNQS